MARPLKPIVADYASKLKTSPEFLGSSDGDVEAPEPKLDLNHPLSHYFMSSSHNTYLSGHQLYGKASAAAYQHVLEAGCRCVEIDVWDGEEASSSESSSDEEKGKRRFKHSSDKVSKWRPDRVEPRVIHGHTATKECSFRDVAETIGLYAFAKTDFPLIVSLEVHASHAQQEIMVEIMHEHWRPYLVEDITASDSMPLPLLQDVLKKILVKVKYSPPKTNSSSTKLAPTRSLDSSGDEAQPPSEAKGKIIPSLGGLGVYTRSYHFSSLTQPEAHIPTHVFSLSESKFSALHAKDPSGLAAHNAHGLVRAYPKGTRVSSSNLDPAPFWRQGAQMVALNWQYVNEGTMLNCAMFSGTGGFVLKPAGLLPDTRPRSGTLDLGVEFFAGQELEVKGKRVRAYVKAELHVETDAERGPTALPAGGAAKEGEHKRRSPTGREGRDVDLGGWKADFRGVRNVTEELSFLRIKVMDDERLGRDDLVGWACFRVGRLREGVRLIHLVDEHGKRSEGTLLVRVTKKFVAG